jgi:calcium permeable stress-gated cation channel
VTREQLFLIGTRQAYLSTKSNASKLSSRVVLFLFAPREALKEDKLQDVFGEEAQKSWIVSDMSQIDDLVGDRNDKAMLLEGAEVKLIREANKRRLDQTKASTSENAENGNSQFSDVPYELRPKHKLNPLVGTKVDTIDWVRKSLPKQLEQVQKAREAYHPPKKPESSAVFVAYSSLDAAQRAYHDVKFHPVVSKVAPDRFLGVQPKEAVWNNLTIAPASRISRSAVATALVITTIIFWSIPVGIVGAISNIKYLADNVKFLHFLNNLPASVIGLLSGFLPPLLISTFVSYVPKIFRCKCRILESRLSGTLTVFRYRKTRW